MPLPDASTWYLCACIDCAKQLKVLGAPPEKPICLHCDVIRAAPEDLRERIRATLRPVEEPISSATTAVAELTDRV